MRITSNMTSDNALYNIQQARAKLDKLNELTASGMYVNRPSDDPINTRLLLDVGDKIKASDQYASNISKSNTWQQFTYSALNSMFDTLELAKKLVSTVNDGSSDPTILKNASDQLTALKQQMVDMGNMSLGNQYLFGGAKNTTAPFSGTAPYYSGDETSIKIEIGPATTQPLNIPGNQILTADTAASQPYGTTNILKTFDDLIAAVNANDVTGIRAGAQALKNGSQQITNAISDVSARMLRLDTMSKLNDNTRNTMSAIYSNTQNVDYAKLAVELTQQQTAFEASLAATAKITPLSLLDYLS